MLLTALAGGSFGKLATRLRVVLVGTQHPGNIGSAVTKLLAPMVMVAYGWHGVARFWAIGLAITAIACSSVVRPWISIRSCVRA